MCLDIKAKWFAENPPWLWFVFAANTVFVSIIIASMLILITQQRYLICEVKEIDRKLVIAIKVNNKHKDINVVAGEMLEPEPLTKSQK